MDVMTSILHAMETARSVVSPALTSVNVYHLLNLAIVAASSRRLSALTAQECAGETTSSSSWFIWRWLCVPRNAKLRLQSSSINVWMAIIIDSDEISCESCIACCVVLRFWLHIVLSFVVHGGVEFSMKLCRLCNIGRGKRSSSVESTVVEWQAKKFRRFVKEGTALLAVGTLSTMGDEHRYTL